MEEKDKELAKQISDEVVKEIKKELPKKPIGRYYDIVKDLITVGLILVIVFFGIKLYKGFEMNTKILELVEDHDLTIDNNGFLGYTAVDFEEAVLGAAKKEALLVVDEQEISVVSTTTKAGLFNLGVFSKNQSVTFVGMSQYAVDLKKLTKENISVDDESHTVTVKVPHAEFHLVKIDHDKTIFADTEKGLLAFGDIKMTQEENNEIEKEATAKLEEKAKEPEPMKKADQYALYVLRDLFETSINSVTNSYKVKVEFVD